MDKFFQILRKIQKKERNNGTLASVDETFYEDIQKYLDGLKKDTISNPFSNSHGILKEAQIIATEICERREHKITDAAVINIHRSYRLFSSDKPHFDLVDSTPLNLTPEEEKFYYSLIDTLKNHRNHISPDKLNDDEDTTPIIKPKEVQKPTASEVKEVLKPKALEPEVKKPKIEKPVIKPKKEPPKKVNADNDIEINPNISDAQDQFVDLESKQIKKDTELVTMLVFDEVGAIMGVDEKVYGPFRSQDIVTLPLVNAKVFFKNRKGRMVKI